MNGVHLVHFSSSWFMFEWLGTQVSRKGFTFQTEVVHVNGFPVKKENEWVKEKTEIPKDLPEVVKRNSEQKITKIGSYV